MRQHDAENVAVANILGIGVSAINLNDAISMIERWIEQRRQNYVCVTGAHGIMECRHDKQLRQIHDDAGMVTPDGMPVVWLARLLGYKRTARVYGPDLMRAVTAISAQRGYRQFYYGGALGLADKLARALTAIHPGLQVAGTISPPFRSLSAEEDEAEVEIINAACPQIVWVGLSTPKQERWVAGHIGQLDAPVIIGVGAAFDFLAGTKRQAPVWMQRSGLEWMFRSCSEPRRLWRRYAYIVPGFAILAAASVIRHAVRPPGRRPGQPRSRAAEPRPKAPVA